MSCSLAHIGVTDNNVGDSKITPFATSLPYLKMLVKIDLTGEESSFLRLLRFLALSFPHLASLMSRD